MIGVVKALAKWLLSRSQTVTEFYHMNRLRPYLERVGWFKSLEDNLPVDRDGNCLPWFTYSMISFLYGRVRPESAVFEYGSGNSTHWWSQRVSSLTSCEHDFAWYSYLKSKIPHFVEYIHCDLEYGGQYCRTILKYENRFNIIVIDGRDRVNCAKNALPALTSDGVIIWDNSDREYYAEGYSFLIKSGFKRLDFEGLGPIGKESWCTSIFYRDQNCFKI